MSRSGYSDDCENLGLWRGAVDRAISGKRGQAFLREMAAAMDAMPEKALIADAIVDSDGNACAIGTVALARGIDVSTIDPGDAEQVAQTFGIARALACEIEYLNDECGESYRDGKLHMETPAERWTRVRSWVEKQLTPTLPPALKNKGDACHCGSEMPWHLVAVTGGRFSHLCVCGQRWQWQSPTSLIES